MRLFKKLLPVILLVLVVVGVCLWANWDTVTYPLKNHLARQEWQQICDTAPATATVVFTDGSPEQQVALAELLRTATFTAAYPPGQSPGTPDWQISWTDENGQKKKLQGSYSGSAAEVIGEQWFRVEASALNEEIRTLAIRALQDSSAG